MAIFIPVLALVPFSGNATLSTFINEGTVILCFSIQKVAEVYTLKDFIIVKHCYEANSSRFTIQASPVID